ncbi:MAG: 3-phosphoshikimate 1-carboxyvinyltransferase [Candidatus Schekmanbacteria bacterium]|nr:3-phosphoshikimate 1-carboxyvinyltransferase [Candidatus Schekmanbacteria bacterium]
MTQKATITPIKSLHGRIIPPGDKSISHRALMLGALAQGKTVIRGLLRGEDCLCTLKALQAMGIAIEDQGDEVIVHGGGLWGLKEPEDVLDMGNSGTSTRLLTGILACQSFFSVLTGDSSLRRRPMNRVIEPLRLMGAQIWGRGGGNYAPLAINGKVELQPIQFKLKQSSAQVKSALLLAGLYAGGVTQVLEPHPSRDHTERMLKAMGANIYREDSTVILEGQPTLQGLEIDVPGDFSSAAFFIAAALIVPDAELTIERVGLNPTRIGFLEAVQQMGGQIEIVREYRVGEEPVGDLWVKSSHLKGINIEGEMVPRMIDEFPIFAVLAAVAEGETVIRQAAELRVKESDRIGRLAAELRKAGVKVEEYEDGMVISGGTHFKGANFTSHGDHRLAMSMAIGALIAKKDSHIEDVACVQTSFPGFFDLLAGLTGQEIPVT